VTKAGGSVNAALVPLDFLILCQAVSHPRCRDTAAWHAAQGECRMQRGLSARPRTALPCHLCLLPAFLYCSVLGRALLPALLPAELMAGRGVWLAAKGSGLPGGRAMSQKHPGAGVWHWVLLAPCLLQPRRRAGGNPHGD